MRAAVEAVNRLPIGRFARIVARWRATFVLRSLARIGRNDCGSEIDRSVWVAWASKNYRVASGLSRTCGYDPRYVV